MAAPKDGDYLKTATRLVPREHVFGQQLSERKMLAWLALRVFGSARPPEDADVGPRTESDALSIGLSLVISERALDTPAFAAHTGVADLLEWNRGKTTPKEWLRFVQQLYENKSDVLRDVAADTPELRDAFAWGASDEVVAYRRAVLHTLYIGHASEWPPIYGDIAMELLVGFAGKRWFDAPTGTPGRTMSVEWGALLRQIRPASPLYVLMRHVRDAGIRPKLDAVLHDGSDTVSTVFHVFPADFTSVPDGTEYTVHLTKLQQERFAIYVDQLGPIVTEGGSPGWNSPPYALKWTGLLKKMARQAIRDIEATAMMPVLQEAFRRPWTDVLDDKPPTTGSVAESFKVVGVGEALPKLLDRGDRRSSLPYISPILDDKNELQWVAVMQRLTAAASHVASNNSWIANAPDARTWSKWVSVMNNMATLVQQKRNRTRGKDIIVHTGSESEFIEETADHDVVHIVKVRHKRDHLWCIITWEDGDVWIACPGVATEDIQYIASTLVQVSDVRVWNIRMGFPGSPMLDDIRDYNGLLVVWAAETIGIGFGRHEARVLSLTISYDGDIELMRTFLKGEYILKHPDVFGIV